MRNPSGGYHTMFRLRLDGNYGAFDALYGYYFIDHDSPDARILDWSEVGGDSNLYQNQGFENRCRPFFELLDYKASAKRYEAVYWDKETDWVVAGSLKNQVFASPMHQIGTRYHDMNWRMPRGTTITRYWRSKKGKWYIPQNRYSDFLPSGRFYHLSDISFVGSWVKDDPNFKRAEPYITTVLADENYTDWISGGKTIGQAWGRFSFRPELADKSCLDAVVSAS
ncbi:MAG: hypothetical protein U9P14_07255, partial [Gemmatimonadota bacterium]|nr:hypothetical protein [Gemmatimonadota bacterium]